MYALLLYALKTGACLAVFYLFFKLLLSRETFHRLNRVVVLSMLALSCVLPCCVLTFTRELPPAVGAELFVEAEAETEVLPIAEAAPVPWREAAGWLYLLGVLCVLGRSVRSMFGVRRAIRAGVRERQADGTVLVRTKHDVAPFSWGRYIVLNDRDLRESGPTILCHEQAHVRLHHSADLLFCDLVCCLQWFNPALWLLRADLRAIHEYEADEAVLASGADARAYQLLLIKKAAGERWYSVANSFNHSKLKNRITMMIQERSSRWAAAKTLLLLPLVGAALGAFAETVYVVPASVSEPIAPLLAEPSDKDTNLLRDNEISTPMQAAEPRKRSKAGTTQTVTVRTSADGTVTTTTTTTTSAARKRGKGSTSVSVSTGGSASQFVVEGLNGRVIRIAEGMPEIADVAVDTVRMVRADGRKTVFDGKKTDAPLIVIDGKEAPGVRLDALSPEAIRSVTVLKDASAAVQYGDAGRNGVILIETKKEMSRTKLRSSSVSVSGDRVVIKTEQDDGAGSSVVSYKGRMTLNRVPAGVLLILDGRTATREEVAALRPRAIRRMQFYKGAAAALTPYGKTAHKGVLEIYTRR